MRPLRALAAAFAYFSIFPARGFYDVADSDAITVLPWVGLAVGAVSGASAYGVWLATHSTIAAAIAAWILSIGLTGAIHVDGFLDCCDGLFAMVPREKRLEIMRDPHHGTYAIVGMAMLSVVWIWALAQIPPQWLFATLLCSGSIARAAAVDAAYRFPRLGAPKPVRSDAVLNIFGMAIPAIAIGALVTWTHEFWLLLAALCGLGLGLPLGWLMSRRLDGLNGDCYGAIVVVTEVALLLAVPYLGVPR